MTDEMLALAEKNKLKAGASNVEFLRGTIEQIPLPDSTVDVIISNCVINLSGDKDKVLREASACSSRAAASRCPTFVLRRELPESARKSMTLWTGCVAGALVESEYVAKLRSSRVPRRHGRPRPESTTRMMPLRWRHPAAVET